MEVNQCRLCCRFHSLRFCHAFKAMTPAERYESARTHRYCINCLATSHATGACDSADSCHKCGKAHHTLLHRTIRSCIAPSLTRPDRPRRDEQRTSTLRRPPPTSRVDKRTTQRGHGRNALQRRLNELFNKAVLTLEQMKELLHRVPVQGGRHVADMSPNLIDL